ncbi:MAG TPA: hypothetical protein DCE44_14680 [Verrucomicrobiales bacterium]|nr:hypothetical protein [Verrucomicrobiales bacterium]
MQIERAPLQFTASGAGSGAILIDRILIGAHCKLRSSTTQSGSQPQCGSTPNAPESALVL